MARIVLNRDVRGKPTDLDPVVTGLRQPLDHFLKRHGITGVRAKGERPASQRNFHGRTPKPGPHWPSSQRGAALTNLADSSTGGWSVAAFVKVMRILRLFSYC